MNFGVVILAGGRSRRMGTPKLLLPWGRTNVLGHLLATWQSLEASQVAVVHAADDAVLQAELDRQKVAEGGRIPNPDPAADMFGSIRCAARWPGWQAALSHWVLVLGDQPHLPRALLADLLAAAAGEPGAIWQPAYQGRPRHPVLLPRSAFTALASATAANLKAFLAAPTAGVRRIREYDEPGLALDVDRPEDYQRAWALARPGAG